MAETTTLKRTIRFVYQNSSSLVVCSICWMLASIPIVTVGPATVGLYAAVTSLRESGRIDRSRVRHAVKTNGVHAGLLGVLPLVFLAVGILYGLTASGPLALGIAVVGLYAGAYTGLTLIPTFIAMARGEPPATALKQGYLWGATNPTYLVHLAVVTLVVFTVTAALTVGFVLLFAGIAAAYHIELVCDDLEPAQPAESPFSLTFSRIS
ncbi:hypothetical protein [Natronorubrum aibiense]|uniref:DUF624 domain-containing protein n=1 Tax=Natronorubrum aibiense TaxID=348826 RepID=A0A5P9PA86_9EURY|nr:hypothetical protein [Natronorubrum aibiense]QFU84780.1 hypothetical protein GCU68_19940 [Natronorubrum aibiense]